LYYNGTQGSCGIDVLSFYMNINILAVNLKGRDYMGELDVNGRIINKWITKKHGVTVYTGFNWLSGVPLCIRI
jgi:hypothetical protein